MPEPVFTDRGRAESFGTVAAKYDKFRPSYPTALVDDLLAPGPRTVLDVGCGTGKAGVRFAARGVDVLGIEIDPKMADVARSHGLTVEVSSFEGWDAHGRTFDLLISGQAWHWVDPSRGVPLAAELVRPGGTVALFWNDDELDPATRRALDDAYREFAPELMHEPADAGGAGGADLSPHAAPFEASDAFDSVEIRDYHWQRTFSADEWVGMCLTHSDHLLLPAARRTALADALHATITRLGGITAPYGTYAVVAHRAA